MQTINNFIIVCVNINSISKNLATLLAELRAVNTDFDLLILTETKLSDKISKIYEIPKYDHVSLNRTRHGGGIRIYYRESFNVSICSDISGNLETHDALFIRLSLKRLSLLIGCIYKSPRLSVSNFNNYLNHTLFNDPLIIQSKCILVGDFNLDLNPARRWPESINNFNRIMKENGYKQYVNVLTRCCHTTGLPVSLLDHAWINFDKQFRITVLPRITDHMPVCLSFDVGEDVAIIKTKFRDFSAYNVNLFKRDIEEIFTNYSIEADVCPGMEFGRLLQFLTGLLNKYFPVKCKQISIKRLNMPWLNDRVVNLINKKHKLFLALKRKHISYGQFKSYCKILAELINRLKQAYFKNRFKNALNDSKKTWTLINMIYGRSKKRFVRLMKISEDTVSNDEQLIANKFNEFFTGIPVEIENSITRSVLNYNNLVPMHNKTLYFQVTSPLEIFDIIQHFKKGGGLNMPVKFLKIANVYLSRILSDIFNLCLKAGCYPEELKIGRLVPIYKKGDSMLITNYRPISILPLLNKVFEKIIYSRIENFFRVNCLLSENQFGFRPKRDTQQATLKLIHHVLENYSMGCITASIFLDFSKAFDTLNRDILLYKLYRYGIRGPGYDLLSSYLSNRRQFTSFMDTYSSTTDSLWGVPQGSCLGPLLYIIYVNDINYLLESMNLILFADDTTLLVRDLDSELLAVKVNFYLSKIVDWCNFNRLSINALKTKCMLFNVRGYVVPRFLLNNEEIEVVTKFQYLGFTLDCRLTHKYHINILISKLKRLKGITYYIRKYLCRSSSFTFYYGMVYSIIRYGILVWGAAIDSGVHKKLEKLHSRIIFNLFAVRGDSRNNIKHILKSTELLTITDIFRYNACIVIYRMLQENYMSYLRNMVLDLNVAHEYSTRNRRNFLLPIPRTQAIKYNLVYQALHAWNSIPLEIRDKPSLNLFKKSLKTYYVNNY